MICIADNDAWLWELWAVDGDIGVICTLTVLLVARYCCHIANSWTLKIRSPLLKLSADVRFPDLGTEIKKVKRMDYSVMVPSLNSQSW